MPVHSFARRDRVTLFLILVTAGLLRVSDLGRMSPYAYDAGDLALAVLKMIDSHDMATVGIQSSAGVPNSPITVYTLLPFYLLTSNPQVIAVLIALWNVVGVGLLWGLAHRYIGPTVAALAGMAYALNPFAVCFSRSIWAQNLHTPILLAAIWLGLYGFGERKRWAQVLCLPAFLWGMQIHYAAWTLMPVFLWCVVIGYKHVAWRALLLSVILGIVTLLPFAFGMTDSSGSFSSRSDQIIAVLKYDWRVRDDALVPIRSVATGVHIEQSMTSGESGAADLLSHVPYPARLWTLMGLLSLIGMGAVWLFSGWRIGGLLVLWVLVPVAVFFTNWTATGIYPHYFVPIIPALCLLAVIPVAWILRILSRYPGLRLLPVAGFAGITLTWGVWQIEALRYADIHYVPEGYRIPTHYLMDVREALQPYDDVLIVGGNSNDSGYHVWRSMLYRSASCVREVVATAGGIAVLPDGPFAVLTPPDALDYPLEGLYNSPDPITVPLRPGEGAYTVNGFKQAPDWPDWIFVPLNEKVRFANGIELLGYQIAENRLILEWGLPGTQPDLAQQRFFGHLLDKNGDKLAQQDVDFWPGIYWCAGDRVVTWIDLPTPEGIVSLRVGMYYFDAEGVLHYSDRLDDTGHSVAPWVDISLTQ